MASSSVTSNAVFLTDVRNSIGGASAADSDVDLASYASVAAVPSNAPIPLSGAFGRVHPALYASTTHVWSYGIVRLFSTYLKPTVQLVREADGQTALAWFEPFEDPRRVAAEDGQIYEGTTALTDWRTVSGSESVVRVLKFFDQSGNGRHASLSSQSAYGAELVQQDGRWAAYFDGAEPFYAIDHFEENGIKAVSNAVEVWIPEASTLDSGGKNGWLVAYDRSEYDRMEVGIVSDGSSASYPTFTYSVDLSDEEAGYELRTQRWTHLAVTFDTQGQDFFVDGRLVRTVARAGSTTNIKRYGFLGTNSEASTYDGDTGQVTDIRFKGYLAAARRYPVRLGTNALVESAHVEAGIAASVDGSFATIPFRVPFPAGLAPVVIPCVEGDNRFTARIGVVTATDFTLKLERGDTSTSFVPQDVHWVAFPPPEALSTGFIGGIRFETHRYLGQNRVVDMRRGFTRGAALAAVQSANSQTATLARGRNANTWATTTVDVQMMTVDDTAAVDETIGLVVIENAQGSARLAGVPVAENGGTAQTLQVTTPDTQNDGNVDHFIAVNYAPPMITSPANAPVAVAFVSTANGGNIVQAHVRNVGRASCEIAAKEPFNEDGTHVDESAHVLSLPAGAHHVSAPSDAAVLWYENFEHNDLAGNGWTVNDGNFVTTSLPARAISPFRGTYVAGIAKNNTSTIDVATIAPAALQNNPAKGRIAAFAFHWIEESASYGGGLRLFNSSGGHICTFVTENSQWTLLDGNGATRISDGTGYENWIRVLFVFDWARGQYAYEVRDDASGVIEAGVSTMEDKRTESGVHTIKISNYDNQNKGFTTERMYMWFDELMAWPGSVPAEPARTWWEGFEHGDLAQAGWTIQDANFQISQPTFVNTGSGKCVAGITASSTVSSEIASITPPALKYAENGKIVAFAFRFYEFGSTSAGGGIRLFDDTDVHVCSFATDNPQWYLDDGDGTTEVFQGNGYEVWTSVLFRFDWRAGTYDYEVSDGTTTKTGTRNLDSTRNVRKLVVNNFHTFDNNFSSTSQTDMYFDDLSVELPAQSWASAVELRDASNGTAPSGVYRIRWDGTNAYDVYCDMDLEGGGWMMILNYVHQGGTNPALDVRGDSFPMLNSADTLGGDESGTASWGHISQALAAQNGDAWEYMFYGRTSNHNRVVHFRGYVSNVVDYVKGAGTTMSGIRDAFTTGSQAANAPKLPAATDDRRTGKGDYALTHFPYFKGASNHWGIRAPDAGSDSTPTDGTRWEVDDYPRDASQDTIHRVWVRPLPSYQAQTWSSAVALRDATGGRAPSGVYKILWDGTNASDVYCDMDLEGGGWMMILNYVHRGGTNPALDIRTSSFPMLNSKYELGAAEEDGSSWGHISQALAAQNGFTEYMFYGKTSNHSRVMHFRGTVQNVIDYIKGNGTTMDGIEDAFTTGSLAANSPNLPGAGTDHRGGQGDFAMTDIPFFLSGTYHWSIAGVNNNTGTGERWEVDDAPSDFSNDTIHRVWVR